MGDVAADGLGADSLVEVVVRQEHRLADGVVVEATTETCDSPRALAVATHHPFYPLGGQCVRIAFGFNHDEAPRP